MIEIPLHVDVHCRDGRIGRSTKIILNPITKKISHFVVREAKGLCTERLVPIKEIKHTTPDLILLWCGKGAFSQMAPFIEAYETYETYETYYIEADMPDLGGFPNDLFIWPYQVSSGKPTFGVSEERLPHELAVHRGTQVKATDGQVGMVEGFFVEPQDGYITHMVLREGHLWGKKEVAIPVSAIDEIKEETVYLKLNKEAVSKLSLAPVAA